MLDSLIDDVRSSDRQFVIHSDDPETAAADWFRNHNVEVTHRPLPEGIPRPFLVVERDREFVGVLDLEEVERLLEPPIEPPADREELSPAHREFFDVLADTVFTSISRRELLAVSREIEDRAYRVGDGTFHVAFQRLSTFRPQRRRYERIAAETTLDVHVHGVDDWTPPESEAIHYHAHQDSRLEPYWVLAFDGGPEEMQASALVAEERPEGGFTGFWTHDETMVQRILTSVASATV